MSLHAFGKVGRPVGARIGSFRGVARVRSARTIEFVAVIGFLILSFPAAAEQGASQPAYDPRQIERQLETQQPPAPAPRPPIRLPRLGNIERPLASRTPQF